MPILRIRDIHLYYETTGQGEPLLFIHGLGSSTRDWERQVAFFCRRYQVITFDVRGHGKSDKPPGPYSVRLFAADAGALIEALGLDRVHVVGISMGGMIAFQLAIDAPNVVKSLVIVNSGPEFVIRTLKERLGILQRLLIVRLLGMGKMGQVLGKRLFPEPEQEHLREVLIERWAENDKGAYLASFRAIVGWSVVAHLGEIRCPVLVVAADQDYTPVSFKEAYAAKLPHAELAIISRSRHLSPIDRPEEFNEALITFLSKRV
jgi:pimeloyl-ACP methyl ester carboxylesterase